MRSFGLNLSDERESETLSQSLIAVGQSPVEAVVRRILSSDGDSLHAESACFDLCLKI